MDGQKYLSLSVKRGTREKIRADVTKVNVSSSEVRILLFRYQLLFPSTRSSLFPGIVDDTELV